MAESTILQKLSLDGNDLSMVPPEHVAKGTNRLQEVRLCHLSVSLFCLFVSLSVFVFFCLCVPLSVSVSACPFMSFVFVCVCLSGCVLSVFLWLWDFSDFRFLSVTVWCEQWIWETILVQEVVNFCDFVYVWLSVSIFFFACQCLPVIKKWPKHVAFSHNWNLNIHNWFFSNFGNNVIIPTFRSICVPPS